MSRRSRPRPPERGQRTGAEDGTGPSLLELERFSTASLRQWRVAADRLNRLHGGLHFGLEAIRKAHGAALLGALRFAARASFSFDGWSRVVDYRYSLAPLSTAGSLKGIGGRFNIGGGLGADAFTPFPALYIAEDYETAVLEKFGATASRAGLSAAELGLRRPESFTQVRLRGLIDGVIDVGDTDSLRPFVDVIKAFALPKSVAMLARQLNLRRPPTLIRSAVALQRQLAAANWRMLPMQYDLPSNSQVFGRIAAAAGLHGILYPAARSAGTRCLALFPQNWRETASWLEVADASPAEARLTRLDGMTRIFE